MLSIDSIVVNESLAGKRSTNARHQVAAESGIGRSILGPGRPCRPMRRRSPIAAWRAITAKPCAARAGRAGGASGCGITVPAGAARRP
jgi:hypothetical protein